MKSVMFALMFSVVLVGCKGESDTASTPNPTVPPVEEPTVPVVPPFVPPVEEPVTAVLSWSAPTTRVNGDSFELFEIEHYLITHVWGDMIEQVTSDYYSFSYTFHDLPSGLHEFDIVTVDIYGASSKKSETVSKLIE